MAVALTAAVLGVYLQSAGFGFLLFDDPDYTFACPFVKDGLSWANVREAFANFRHGAVWMPLSWLSYMADVSLLGRGAAGHHLANVLLHIANALLLLRLALSMAAPAAEPGNSGNSGYSGESGISGRIGPAAFAVFAVFFWAIHPQRVEAVAWIASRKELLWAFFALLGLLAWRRGRCFAAFLCCAAACMSKPTAMVFPLLAFLAAKSSRSCIAARSKIVAVIVMFAMAAATGAAAIYSQTHPEGMAAKDLFYAPLGERLLNAAVSTGLYLAQMFVPAGIHLDYRAVPGAWPLHGALGLTVAADAAVAICVAAWIAVRKPGTKSAKFACAVLWCAAFFAVALMPTLGIFGSFGEHARADRFLYVPAMALPLALARLAGGSSAAGFSGNSRLSRLSSLAVCGLLAVFSAVSFRVAASYRDDLSVFSRTLECDPGHGRALAHVGEAKCAAGDLDAGIELLRRSQETRPRDATAGKLAYALMRRGRSADWDEIRAVCAPFVADPARDAKGQALEALGTAALAKCEWKTAADMLARSIVAPARFYSAADAKLKLAYAWHNSGRRSDARKVFEAVARSSRADLAARAETALSVLDGSPGAILFW